MARSDAVVGKSRTHNGETGVHFMRVGIAALAVLVLAGCANDRPFASTGLGFDAANASPLEPQRDPSRKTLAGKTLAAIALERVTGRKPDPSRLAELN